MEQGYQRQARTKLIALCVTIAVIAGIVLIADYLGRDNTTAAAAVTPASSAGASSGSGTTTPTTTSTDTTSQAAGSSSTTSGVQDGTYTAQAEYYVPHGYEDISVTITVKAGVVTDSTIVNSQGDHESAQFQQRFASSYKQYVVGKSLAGLKLSYVAGASDTTDGFNDALSQIRTKAQS